MNFETFADIESISQQACQDIEQLARQSIQNSGVFRISLAGGSTPKRLYQLMAANADRFDWPRIQLYWGDERNVPAEHADSNFRMVKEALIDHVPLPESNIHRVPVDESDSPAACASAYEATLLNQFGSAPLSWDLVLLGMGDDAHTASLFPGTTAIDANDRLFVENWVEKFDCFRLTLTAPAINSAKNIWFMIGGAGKREALQNVWGETQDGPRFPSQLIQPTSGKLRWMIAQDLADTLT